MTYNPYQFQNPYQQMYNQPIQDQLSQFRQPYQTPQFQSQAQQQNPYQSGSGVIWVQGEEGAKAYMVAPGNSVLLMDSEHSSFYMKSCDQSGMPSMRIFDYTERTAQKAAHPQTPQMGSYATRDEIEALRTQVASLQAQIATMTGTREENDNA